MFSKPLNAIVAVLLIIFGALYFYTAEQEKKYQNTAVLWLKDNVPFITTWDPDQTWTRLAPEAKELVSQSQLNTIIKDYRLMGRLKSMEEPVFSKLASAFSALSWDKKINYSAQMHFSNADALLTITLVKRDGQFKIYNLNLSNLE